MSDELRDYVAWHDAYADPGSGLSWRLRTVQGYLRRILDERAGPVRIISVCAGDGRDVIEVLAARSDAARVRATLVELHPDIAGAARERAAAAGLGDLVEVRAADAARSNEYRDLAPADVVLLVGIFGNISDADIQQTIAAAPQLCAPGAALLWSRGRDPDVLGDRNDAIREWFGAAGFVELDYATHDEGSSHPALGLLRYDGPSVPLEPGRTWFTFHR